MCRDLDEELLSKLLCWQHLSMLTLPRTRATPSVNLGSRKTLKVVTRFYLAARWLREPTAGILFNRKSWQIEAHRNVFYAEIICTVLMKNSSKFNDESKSFHWFWWHSEQFLAILIYRRSCCFVFACRTNTITIKEF